MTLETSPRDRVSRVGDLLNAIGNALVDGRPEPLLETEQELGPAVQALVALATAPSPLLPQDRVELRVALARCEIALARCRRLGGSLDQFTAATLETGGRSGVYTRGGLATLSVPPSGGIQVRA